MTAPGGAGGLARYVVAATLARTADGGAVVAIVLLATTAGRPGWEAGLLGASITAPHLLGPFVARRLDVARDGRSVIALACLLHGATLTAAVLLLPVVPPLVVAAILVVSGLVGPLLTGGISSRLPAIAGPDRGRQRRAQGWDVATYGLGGTIGPSVVAAISAWASPTLAAVVLAAATFAAAAVVRVLPFAPPAADAAAVPRPLKTLGLMTANGPLRRTLVLTVVVALSVAVLPVTAVAGTRALGLPAAAAGLLTAAYGFGNLAGAAAVLVRPLRGAADVLMTRLAAAVAGSLLLVGLAPTAPLALTAYALAGILNACFFAATLAARNEYAPPAAKGQVFVWVGALKITAGSAGTAAAGALVGAALHLPVAAGCALTATAAIGSLVDRGVRRPVRADA
ncbi:MFS transporter [Amnibacterium sp. CER49]|uniref:MFS transporter n=1 Tax=Amnibacterium sp. CER49 TaxID=3039161 RepID=UPI00244909BE|nr:MFS transporter [Amnibacterium sp. CER49]MDH2443359.1 MFS transporter [Amnibacterium sp. CER49]